MFRRFMFDGRHASTVGVALAVLGLSLVGCTDPDPEANCERDSDCAGERYCIAGQCEAPSDGADATGASDISRRDGDLPRPDDASVEAGPGPIPDARSPEDTTAVSDGASPHPDVSFDDGRRLSCREMSTCGRYFCDRFDYECKQQFSSRTPDSEKQTREDLNSCIQEHCTGKSGQEWVNCLAEECASRWESCYASPDDDAPLRCSGFQACIQKCSTADDPRSCRVDCQERAAETAPDRLEAFDACSRSECPGTTGQERLDCINRHCHSELSACYGC